LHHKFNAGVCLFRLKKYEEAIPVFQESQRDPKFRSQAAVYLGRAFHEAGFPDEAVDTLKTAIDEYQIKGDDKSKNMYYWYGRSLESKGDADAALKAYSQVAQWDFNFLDVQQRIKKLRNERKNPPA
jgi:tetratricopeptide (TPR) repeat protein